MSAITEPAQDILEQTQQSAHPSCILCGNSQEGGLGLCFSLSADGGVEAHFDCPSHWQGYAGILHGGITSALLDGAMTHCLFARAIIAVTGEMTVRFRHPIDLHTPLVIQAQIVRSQRPLHLLQARITQDGHVKAKAKGKFMERSAATYRSRRREK